MALVHLNFESQYLNNNTDVNIILPDKPRGITPDDFYGSGKKYKVLWLLHGTYGDYTDWIRKSNIELYACEKDLIVVMPSALNSNYANWDECMMGYGMYDYFFKELMPLVYNWFPASDKREDNFVAGLSMGGRGTIKFAANHPEKFAAAAILSAAPSDPSLIDMETDDPRQRRWQISVKNSGGLEAYINSCENSWRILNELCDSGTLPRLYFAIGMDDGLYANYKVFKKHAEEIGLDATFDEIPGFKHEWRFWDLTIQKALKFFGLDGDDAGNPY